MSFVGTVVELIASWLILLGLSVWFHELGHAWSLKYFLKRDVKIVFDWKARRFVVGKNTDYTVLSPRKKIVVYSAGILLGLVPLVLAGLLSYLYWPALVFYVWGCEHDVRNIKSFLAWDRMVFV